VDRLGPGLDLAVEAFDSFFLACFEFEFEVEVEVDRLEVPLPRPRVFNFIGVCSFTGDISGNPTFRFLDTFPSNGGNEEDVADG